MQDLPALQPTAHIEAGLMMQTSVAGAVARVFAAGYMRKNAVIYSACSAGDGATAAIAAARHVRQRRYTL